jgi:hypothetical protein
MLLPMIIENTIRHLVRSMKEGRFAKSGSSTIISISITGRKLVTKDVRNVKKGTSSWRKDMNMNRLKEAARFLKEGETYSVMEDNAYLQVRLVKSQQWLYVGMRWVDIGFATGRNLDGEMQLDDNFEYWVRKVKVEMNEMRDEHFRKEILEELTR